jgi:serine/threonine protein kinase
VELISSFKSVVKTSNEVFLNLVMTYLPASLHDVVKSYRQARKYMPLLYVKLFAFQMFSGLRYLHEIGITHRDLKPENVLVDMESGLLRICDLGSAKMLRADEPSVSYIASRYYRAPELTLGCEHYTPAVDIWAAGCVVGEVLTGGMPLFPGNAKGAQIEEISKVLGPPTSEDLKSFEHMKDLPDFPRRSTSLERILPKHVPQGLMELLSQIFVHNPSKRPSAEEIVAHPYFDDLFMGRTALPDGHPFPALER